MNYLSGEVAFVSQVHATPVAGSTLLLHWSYEYSAHHVVESSMSDCATPSQSQRIAQTTPCDPHQTSAALQEHTHAKRA
jgi:hypothetical protein